MGNIDILKTKKNDFGIVKSDTTQFDKMGGKNSRLTTTITLGRIYVSRNDQGRKDNERMIELKDKYGVDTKNVEMGPETIMVSSEHHAGYGEKSRVWKEAIEKALMDSKIIKKIEIDCSVTSSLGEARTYNEVLAHLRKFQISGLKIHFVNVWWDRTEEISKFINHFNQNGEDGEFFFEISHYYVRENKYLY